jgi:hypothetical protein
MKKTNSTLKKTDYLNSVQIQKSPKRTKGGKRGGKIPPYLSNLTPLIYDQLGMDETEQAFAEGIISTKNNLVQSIQLKVDAISRLLQNKGGFSAHLENSFARSTVVFLEREDPKYPFRERIVFSINLPQYKLNNFKIVLNSKDGIASKYEEDEKKALQLTWDQAVNALEDMGIF